MFLEELEDISDDLIIEDPKSIFDSDVYILDFIETVFLLMDEYVKNDPTAIADPDFNENLFEDIKHIFEVQFEDQLDNYMCAYDVESDIDELFEYAFQVYISSFLPERSIDHTSNMINSSEHNINPGINQGHVQLMEDKINKLRNIPQPVQRTSEWYTFRHNLITASNAHKAFDSKSSINQLIYEKCQPVKSGNQNEEIKMTNLNTPLHWGQKYEPLSVMVYEHLYNTKVEDFGCLPHSQYSFIGASPDGIIVNQESDRFGRMLEIKNVVSREITGIPKKEYWVQMQLQMEVCNLDECDFLETKFIEYDNADAYWSDTNVVANTVAETNVSAVKKGVIMYFHTKEGKPFYKYMPLNIVTFKDVSEWQEQMIDLYQSSEYKYIWIKDCYWKLAILSCVLVCRNRQWFHDNIDELGELWSIIEKERVSGFEHRAPNRKTKGENAFQLMAKAASTNAAPKKCLLQFNKENGKITILKSDPTVPTVESIVIDKLDINIVI